MPAILGAVAIGIAVKIIDGAFEHGVHFRAGPEGAFVRCQLDDPIKAFNLGFAAGIGGNIQKTWERGRGRHDQAPLKGSIIDGAAKQPKRSI